eukprot:1578795-Amphidinium_carterae.2
MTQKKGRNRLSRTLCDLLVGLGKEPETSEGDKWAKAASRGRWHPQTRLIEHGCVGAQTKAARTKMTMGSPQTSDQK